MNMTRSIPTFFMTELEAANYMEMSIEEFRKAIEKNKLPKSRRMTRTTRRWLRTELLYYKRRMK